MLKISSMFAATLAVLWIATGTLVAQDKAPSKEKEQALIAVLKSDAPGGEKALACKGLAVNGSAEAVPELAKLLSDEKLASWARIALEAIPGPEANEALRKAAETLNGRLLIGAINSLGVRRDAAAVEVLAKQLKGDDAEVGSSAAAALGRIGNEPAAKALKEALAGKDPSRSAAAEGCVLAAEQWLAAGKSKEASDLYDLVRAAEVPQQRKLEATRGAILARGTAGIPLLLEQLRAKERGFLFIGLNAARELPGEEVTEALSKEVASAAADRAALILYALADREIKTIPPSLLDVVKSGKQEVRVAAINLVGQKGNEKNVPNLLAVATEANAEIATAAKTALKDLAGDKVNGAITELLAKSDGKTLAVLFELVGQRRISAIPAVVKALDHSDAAVRAAAITALGETAGAKDVAVLLARVTKPKNDEEGALAQKALRAASVRMPEREATAAELASAMPKANMATRVNLLETLGAMGGPKALETIASAVKGSEPDLQDAGSKLLGEWMTIDAAPTLLDIAKTVKNDKYQVRAIRGYLRLARQFPMPDKQRAEIAQNALDLSTRVDEQKLALTVLERYPSMETLPVALKAMQVSALKEDATRIAMFVAQKVTQKDEAAKLMIKAGIEPVKVEIVKATFGAGDKQRDVTAILQKAAGDYPLVVLASTNYNKEFGGDPAPGAEKKLTVQYKIGGKPGETSFAENTAILLPAVK